MLKRMIVVLAVTLLSCIFAVSAATAETVSKSFDTELTKSRWTPEAYAGAKALPLPRVQFDPSRVKLTVERAPTEDFVEEFPSSAEAPTISDREAARFARRLFDFTPEELRRLRGQEDEPERIATKNFGTGGLDYTSSRLMPSSAVDTFPYRAAGRLFFSDGTSNFVCSASVITKRLVVTAGHCVHGGPAEGFYDDFVYVPAYQNGNAPFGSWSATTAFVTGNWAASGQIPHPEDFAILEMEDQSGSTLSQVTGKFAFIADLLADNHLTMLGYPTNLDGGEEIHQVTSGDWFDFGDGTVAYGSDMGGGSSGGPWLQNFNRKARGQGGGRNRARLAVVSVTSFGFVDDVIRAQGASKLGRNFKVLRQDACRNQAGNC